MDQIQAQALLALQKLNEVCSRHELSFYLAEGTLLGAVRHKGFIPWDDDIDVVMPRPQYEALKALPASEWGEAYVLQYFSKGLHFPTLFIKLTAKGTFYADKRVAHHQYDHGISIDIFPLDGVAETAEEQARHNRSIQRLRKIWACKMKKPDGRDWLLKLLVKCLALPLPAKTLYRWIHNRCRAYSFEAATQVCNYFSVYPNARELFPKAWLEHPAALEFEGEAFLAVSEWDKHLTRVYGDYLTPPPLKQRKAHQDGRITG